jgi:hypothetical protein
VVVVLLVLLVRLVLLVVVLVLLVLHPGSGIKVAAPDHVGYAARFARDNHFARLDMIVVVVGRVDVVVIVVGRGTPSRLLSLLDAIRGGGRVVGLKGHGLG